MPRPSTSTVDLRFSVTSCEGLLLALIGAAVAPLWLIPWFPSQDGPSHAYNAWMLLHIHDAPYRAFYEPSLTLIPNWAGTAWLLLFGPIVGLRFAEKLLLTAAVVLFCLGFARWVRGGRPSLPAVALLGPVLALNYPLSMGFYSFALGVALVPWCWAFAREDALTVRRSLGLGALLVLTYFAHIAAVLVAVLGVALFAASHAFRARSWAVLARRVAPVLAVAPLMVVYALTLHGGDTAFLDVDTLAELLATLRVVATGPALAEHIGLGCAIAIIAIVAVSRYRREPAPLVELGALLVVTTALFFALPDGSRGHWFLSERLSLFPWLALCALATTDRFRAAQLAVLTALCVGHITVHTVEHARVSTEVDAYVALGEHIERDATILPITFDRGEVPRTRPFLHAAGWIGVSRNAVIVSNYESQTDHFQTRQRSDARFPPNAVVASSPESLDWDVLAQFVDYVIVRNGEQAQAGFREEVWLRWAPAAKSGPNVLYRKRTAQ